MTAPRMTTEIDTGIGVIIEAINTLEQESHDAEAEPSDIRWEQAKHVAAALDSGVSTRQLAARKAYMSRLAMRSAQARRRGGAR